MVSTRGIRYKFSEGERVLCYEPDPTKAKVLYDSKVLEVIENKDKKGRRSTEYLIHFQGWNSSWDRCVGEDFVLKDTEENRLLQRDLAEKSQLQLGSYLYRRERKKAVSTSAGAGAAKRARHGLSDDGSSSSTPLDVGDPPDTDSSSGSGAQGQPPSQPRSPPPQPNRAQINLPAALRARLTFDYHLVVKRGRLSRLPASPCAAEILESFVKWFARAGAWRPQRARHDPPQRPNLHDVSCRLNLVREVADGLRVYFDFVLRGHLLYQQEQAQYQEACGQYHTGEEGSPRRKRAPLVITSPNMPEYSHLPPDPENRAGHAARGNSESGNSEEHKPEVPKYDPYDNDKVKVEEIPGGEQAVLGMPERPKDARPGSRVPGFARRLRSHKSAVSHSEEEPAPSTSTGEPRAFETLSSSVGSSASSVSECWARPAQATAPPSNRTPLSLLLDKVSAWKIVPREGTEHLPCRVYGAIHLSRLFVRLPDFLAATHMPDYKLKLVLKHVDMFIQYLEEHGEWFGEPFYIAQTTSRPPE